MTGIETRGVLDAALTDGSAAYLLVAADACAEAGDECGEAFCRRLASSGGGNEVLLRWVLGLWRHQWRLGWRPLPGWEGVK